jgi:hypothetical protein
VRGTDESRSHLVPCSQANIVTFESALSWLKVDTNKSVIREVEEKEEEWPTQLGQVIIIGGGISVRMRDGRARSVPDTITIGQVEMLEFLALAGLEDENVREGHAKSADSSLGAWWQRRDLFLHDEIGHAQRGWWAAVDKGALPEPAFAPRFPGTSGASADWEALLARVVSLHNEGSLPGFITCGARGAWPVGTPVYPTLKALRDVNLMAVQGACCSPPQP